MLSDIRALDRVSVLPMSSALKAIFVDANPALASIFDSLHQSDAIDLRINRQPDITPLEVAAVVGDAKVAIVDHTRIPTEVALRCPQLKHIVFLGTGARSYMNPEELASHGIAVHTIKGYGDQAVAEHAFALMWAAARGLASMDRGMRKGEWRRTEGMQLKGKTLGLIGFGGIGAALADLAVGIGMQVIAWNRSPRSHAGVSFVEIDQVLSRSDVVSLHLVLDEQTRGFLSEARLAEMREGVILINTARGALVDERAMVTALRAGKIRHAGLDVFDIEPLPSGHVLAQLPNVTLSAHSAFRTPEANAKLVQTALAFCQEIAQGIRQGVVK